jgi:hypothetical protein
MMLEASRRVVVSAFLRCGSAGKENEWVSR